MPTVWLGKEWRGSRFMCAIVFGSLDAALTWKKKASAAYVREVEAVEVR